MGAGFSIIARGKAAADVFLYEDIGASFFGGVTAKDFAAELKTVGNVDTLNVHINSAGGDVFDGLAIYNQLTQHPAKVISHIDGLAGSIASVIAMAGDTINISESGFVMIHNASGGVLGEAGDMRKMADLLDKVTGSITDVYVERTKGERETIVAQMNEETWFTGEEALKAGFADAMVTNLHVAARIDPKHNFKHLPAALARRPVFDAARDRLAEMRASVQRQNLRAV